MNATNTNSKFLSRYIIVFNYNDRTYYSFWGADYTDEERDKFLIDADKNILLFTSIEKLSNYVLKNPNLVFDTSQIQFLLGSIGSLDLIYQFDISMILKCVGENKEQLFDEEISNIIVDLLNLVGDYAFQVDNEELICLFQNEIIQLYLDFNYDNYFWLSETNSKLNEKSINSLNINYFYDLILEVKLIMLQNIKVVH